MRSRKSDPESTLLEVIQVNFRRHSDARLLTDMLEGKRASDTANVMGPCLVTADEIEDPYNLAMIARVNGEEWGRGNSRDMRWKFEDIIAHVSRSETLYPGEFLGSGTVGNGCGFEQMRYLKADDIIELEVQQIGVLRSRVVRPQASIATSE